MIAEAMVRSVSNIPHAWSTVEVDVTGLVALRASVRAEFEQREREMLIAIGLLGENSEAMAQFGTIHV